MPTAIYTCENLEEVSECFWSVESLPLTLSMIDPEHLLSGQNEKAVAIRVVMENFEDMWKFVKCFHYGGVDTWRREKTDSKTEED